MMKIALMVLLAIASGGTNAESRTNLANPRIDAKAFLAITQEALRYREKRRVSEHDFKG